MKTSYTKEELKHKFNFIPFVSEPTHRIEIVRPGNYGGVSCPANFLTDEEAIEAGQNWFKECTWKDKTHCLIVRKYDNNYKCDNIIYQSK